jgi:hypothetical protein
LTIFTARIAETALSASTTRTLIQVIPASDRPVKLLELGCSFDGVDGTKEPVLVELVRESTGGTASALTLVKDQEQSSQAIVATARSGFSSTEPTTGDVLRSWEVTPAGGLLVVQWPLDREPMALSNRLAVRVTTGSGVTNNVVAYMTCEE